MKKRYLLLLPAITLSLSNCALIERIFSKPVNDNNKDVTCQYIPIVNKATDDYTISGDDVQIFTIGNSDVPYVDILNFMKSFNGFFKYSEVEYSFNKKVNYLSLNCNTSGATIKINWKENTISASAYYAFECYSNGPKGTSYSDFISSKKEFSDGGVSFKANLSNYHFDILYYKGKVLLPLCITNSLFCSTSSFNVFYNEEKCFATYGETTNLEEYYQTEKNQQSQSEEMRKASLCSLLFTFNYLYGLKEFKGYSDGFKKHLSNEILDLINSTEALDNYSAYKQIVYSMLDELHTRIDMPSYYCNPTQAVVTDDDYGEFWNTYRSTRTQQRNIRTEGTSNVRYVDNLAIITFDSFVTGSRSELFDEYNHLKDDAWKYDTYYFMRKCMSEIKTHSNITNITIDLSLNGGGNTGAMIRALGFITDKGIKYNIYDTLAKYYYISNYSVDTDGDGVYANDAYDTYKWSLLTGVNTFSAANLFTSIFREMSLGKIYGQRSGGGMCAIMSTVLADGTAITISSPMSFRRVKKEGNKRVFYAIESGIAPDVTIDYSDFYNDSVLAENIL